jgi:hypothetical protein
LEDIRRHHEKRKTTIFDRLSAQPKTTYAVSDEMTDSTLSDFDKFLALNETFIYLKELKAEGVIKEDMVGNVLVYTR